MDPLELLGLAHLARAKTLLPDGETPLPGVVGGALSWLVGSIAATAAAPVVVVAGRPQRADALFRELCFFHPPSSPASPTLLTFPAWETLPFEPLSPHPPLVAERLTALFRLGQLGRLSPTEGAFRGDTPRTVLVTTAAALLQRVPPRQVLLPHGFSLVVGDQLDLPAFRSFLTIAGYRPAPQVEEPGDFSIRGGILDLFPPDREEPVRAELFGDMVESLKLFDPADQRSRDHIARLHVLPASELILNEETIRAFRTNYRSQFGGSAALDPVYRDLSQGSKPQGAERYLPLFFDGLETLLDYLPRGTLFLVEADVGDAITRRCREIEERHLTLSRDQANRCLKPEQLYLPGEELAERLQSFPRLALQPGGESAFLPPPHFEEEKAVLAGMVEQVKSLVGQGVRVGVCCRTAGKREKLRERLAEKKLTGMREVGSWREILASAPGTLALAIGDIAHGFQCPSLKLALFSEEEILGQRIRGRETDRRRIDQILSDFSALRVGDALVHADYGVGRHGGLTSLEVGGVRNDFLLIHYAEETRLYVPIESLDRVAKYTGGEDPPLDKLGGTRWERARERTRKEVMRIAGELVAFQAKRNLARGVACTRQEGAMAEFAAGFAFEETPDQAGAIEAVLADMQSTRPMDRLVCGDVGFGKTEVALRAAFQAVLDGHQVAFLVPTTILAQQHFETFQRRFSSFPYRLALLSRFRSAAESRETIQEIADGKVDIVIGTHRILQKDIVFKDLGLVVVDEEQRFGVVHKERIKAFRANVDLLTLTATPIPRTMNMALSGIRDISIIATPPPDRVSIRTQVTPYDAQLVRESVLRELYRGGQVFYLHNDVSEIEKVAEELATLVPEARVGVAHGQMRESRLSRIMNAFYHQEFNLLVCTTIIENGVDIPTANTILINRADRFGLAQLHQLRGRVGRSRRRAYAYLLVPSRAALAGDAARRLEAIESLGDLGSGFLLASHDMEIRGAGNILGEEQSGRIEEVGFELYNQMLEDAVRALQGEEAVKRAEEEIVPAIQLGLATSIPPEYVADVQTRLVLYKRIAGLASAEEIREMRAELHDRFGPLPESVEHLLKVMGVKRLCLHLRITSLLAGPKGGEIQFHAEPRVNPMAILEFIQSGRGNVTFNQEKRALSFARRAWENDEVRLSALREILERLGPT